jgi:signal transduction histidine kinase
VVRLALTIRENDRRLRDQARRDLQTESDRLESLRRVAAGVAHAFNNSLTVVLGEADLGIASRPPPAAERAFVQIRRAGERSAALTRHLLWFTGRQHRSQAPIEIATWLRVLQPDLRAAAGPNLSLEIDAGRGEAWLDGDEAQLREVLLELVRNASEAAGGRGTVRITRTELRFEDPAPRGLRDPLPSGPYACLAVRDSGRGMEPEVVARVFDPFFSSRRADPSAGLGLSLAYGVVRAHGGRIEVESAPDRGSEFRVLLPLSAGAPARR